MIGASDPVTHLNGLRLALWVSRGAVHVAPDGYDIAPVQAPEEHAEYWDTFAYENAKRYSSQVTEASSYDEGMLYACLRNRFRTGSQRPRQSGTDLTQLLQAHRAGMFGAIWIPYMVCIVGAAMRGLKPVLHSGLPGYSNSPLDEDFTACRQVHSSAAEPPWASICFATRYEPTGLFSSKLSNPPGMYKASSPVAYLGGVVALLLTAEAMRDRTLPPKGEESLGTFSDLYPYILRRWDADPAVKLPDLPVPTHFQYLFRDMGPQERGLHSAY